MINSHKDLIAWQKAMILAKSVYSLMSQLPKSEIYGLSSQAQRSAVSIPSNIAEGFRRRSNNDFIRFLRIAYGSCAELETQIILASEIYEHFDTKTIVPQVEEVSRLINGLFNSIIGKSATRN